MSDQPRVADPNCPKCKGVGFISRYNSYTQALAVWCKCTEPEVKPAEVLVKPFDWLKAIREASS
jgi:hypothetical protein